MEDDELRHYTCTLNFATLKPKTAFSDDARKSAIHAIEVLEDATRRLSSFILNNRGASQEQKLQTPESIDRSPRSSTYISDRNRQGLIQMTEKQ